MRQRAALLLCCLLLPQALSAQESNLEDALEGFSNEAAPAAVQPEPVAESVSSWALSGRFEALAAFAPGSHQSPSGLDNSRGLTSLRGRLDLAADGRPAPDWRVRLALHTWHDLAYDLRGSGHFRQQQVDDQQRELAADELWLDGRLGSRLSLRLGRQVLGWSRCDIFRPADVFSAQDLREPGLSDGRESTLAPDVARFDLREGDWRWQFIAQPRPRFDQYPPYGADYYPFVFPLPPRQHVSPGLDAAGWGLRASRELAGGGLSWHLASAVREQELVGISPQVTERPLRRLLQGGISGDLAWQSWVFKGDLALVDGLAYYNLPDQRKTRLDLALGGDYAGWRDSTFTVELLYRHLFDLERGGVDDLDLPAPDVLGVGFRATRRFFRERLRLGLGGLLFGIAGSHGGLLRVSAEWAMSDNLSLQAGAVLFLDGDNYVFQHLDGTERLFLRLRRTF